MGEFVMLCLVAFVALGVFIQLAVLSALFEKIDVLNERIDGMQGYIVDTSSCVHRMLNKADDDMWRDDIIERGAW